MITKGIRVGICHKIHWHIEANNMYMSDYDQNKESSHVLEYEQPVWMDKIIKVTCGSYLIDEKNIQS